MQFLLNLPWWAWNNKIKSLLIIIVLYGTHKAYCLYRDWVKPFLDLARPVNALQPEQRVELELDGNGDYYDEIEDDASSVSMRLLKKLASSHKDELVRIQILQTTLDTTRQSLRAQDISVSKLVFETAFNLQDAKDKTTMGNLDARQKQERYRHFKACVMNSFFSYLIGVRMANLVSVITITQTGRYYYRNSMGLKKGNNQLSAGDDQTLMKTFAQVSGFQSEEQDDFDKKYDELLYQLNLPAIEKQRQLLPKDEEQMKIQM